jgi:nucleotide-binding universal stress UspA family protein
MTVQSAPGTRPVVVGVDGSDSALAAVRWAAVEADRRAAPLRLVTAFPWTRETVVGNPVLGERYRDELMARAERHIADARVAAERAVPALPVSPATVVGSPIGVLGAEARDAQLLVLGTRGLGGLTGLLVGSVAVGLAAQAACPVVVVRGEDRDPFSPEPVVVGVDGSPNSGAALGFAFDAAADRKVPLVAVHTWADPVFDPQVGALVDWAAVDEDQRALLSQRLAGWTEKYPEVPLTQLVVHDGAGRTLVELSKNAQLVVVGSRGRGNFTGLVLGSVSHAVLHGSRCPVAVVRADTATTPASR